MKAQRIHDRRNAGHRRRARVPRKRGLGVPARANIEKLAIFAGTGNRGLAEAIAADLGMDLGDVEISRFASSEGYVRFRTSVRGIHAFVIQGMCDPIDHMIMEQLIMIDALKRASTRRVTAVCPLYPYSRQDRKARGREPITAKLVAELYETAGADRIVSVDLHAPQIQGFFRVPFDHLTALPVLADHVASSLQDGFVIVAPDAGALRLADKWARHLSLFHRMEADVAYLHKRRITDKRNLSETLAVVGDVKDRQCVLVDDMIDTAGTIVNGVDTLVRAGAREVVAAATHPILSGSAVARLEASALRELVVTDTVPIGPEKDSPKITVQSIAPLIAAAIKEIFAEGSVSTVFHGENV
ncbi:MAG: ribose-phosphate diphosphokinase [Actinobacteria bacterium]|nr:ribose-phosphate diphosphokinase [Actinomycetota bacterium]